VKKQKNLSALGRSGLLVLVVSPRHGYDRSFTLSVGPGQLKQKISMEAEAGSGSETGTVRSLDMRERTVKNIIHILVMAK
jgi:hypothetical protein